MFAGGLKIKNVLSPNTFKHKHKCSCKKQRKENLLHVFIVDPLAHNTHKKVLPTQTNTARKNWRFISVLKNPMWAIRITGITVNKG